MNNNSNKTDKDNRENSIFKLVDLINKKVKEEGENYFNKLHEDGSIIIDSFPKNPEELSIDLAKKPIKCGLYFFEVRFKSTSKFIENFKTGEIANYEQVFSYLDSEWKKANDGVEEREHIPSIIKKRIQKTDMKNSTSDWIPFYLGKSKNTSGRLNEHLFGFTDENGAPKESTTYSLRLNEIQKGTFKDCEFRIHAIELDNEYNDEKHYWIVTNIEMYLREKLNPICGKQ